MSYCYKNRFNKTIHISIEPLCESYYLKENEELIISVFDEKPIDINVDENLYNGEEIIVLNMNNHIFYKVEIKN